MVLPIEQVIPETHLVIFAPHYDDVLLGPGGYLLELKALGLLQTKRIHILLLFSRSNYQAGSGPANFDTSLERIQYATGRRLLEDLECLDELLGEHQYRYELLGERECFVRGKSMADSEMEFPHGLYEDFTPVDDQILDRMKSLVLDWADRIDTALIFPLAIKEHIDHFITREAGIRAARELGHTARAGFYFQEDKPYGGIATPDEWGRIEEFVRTNHLQSRVYYHHPEEVVRLAFRHYTSQVEDVYRQGIMKRSEQLAAQLHLPHPADQIYSLPRQK